MSRLVPSRLTVVRAVLLVLGALLAAVVVPRFAPVEPDLLVPVIVAGGLCGGRTTGALLGLAAGWLTDLIPPGTGTFGLSALTYAAAGLLAGALHRHWRHSPALPALAVCAAALTVQGVSVIASAVEGRPIDLIAALLGVLATTAIGTAVVPALLHHEQRLVHRGRA
ncbi:hypothetical protein [Demetria terragena]|uniref:hypothetical protein n=1 Tax=Demetria terragena TaxID=63959 RepID=UPI000475D46C|nr:hypothetical protein [Demetria terragena]